jgi:hypothetical protein
MTFARESDYRELSMRLEKLAPENGRLTQRVAP